MNSAAVPRCAHIAREITPSWIAQEKISEAKSAHRGVRVPRVCQTICKKVSLTMLIKNGQSGKG